MDEHEKGEREIAVDGLEEAESPAAKGLSYLPAKAPGKDIIRLAPTLPPDKEEAATSTQPGANPEPREHEK